MKKNEIIEELAYSEGFEDAQLHKHLRTNTAGINRTPTPELFVKIYHALLEYHTAQIASVMTILADGIIESHRSLIIHLRKISVEIGIHYTAPVDTILTPAHLVR